MGIKKKGLKNLSSIVHKVFDTSAKPLLRRGKNFVDEAARFTSENLANKKKELGTFVEEGKQTINVFTRQLINRKCEVQESIGNYLEDKSQTAKTTYTIIANRVEDHLSIGKSMFNDFAESYKIASKMVGRKMDEQIYDSLKELRLKTISPIITIKDIIDKSQCTISSDFKRIDDEGYLNFTKDEILSINSFCQFNRIEFFPVIKELLSIQFESHKNDSKLETYARLAAYVYGGKNKHVLPTGWEIINRIPNVRFEDKDTGLKSVLFRRRGTSEYVYGFAGTRDMKDWGENAKQIVGLSEQYDMALENAKRIKEYFSLSHLTFTGHSQGGGEAAMCAYNLGDEAITFNPAGMSPITKGKALSLHSIFSVINSYIYLSDVLNIAQQLTDFIPFLSLKADGEVHYIYDNIPRNFTIKEWHGMEGFLNYFGIPILDDNCNTERIC